MDNNIQMVDKSINNNQKKKGNGFLVFIIVVLLLIIAFGGGYITNDILDKKSNDANNNEVKNEDNKIDDKKDEDEKESKKLTKDDIKIEYSYKEKSENYSESEYKYYLVTATITLNGKTIENNYSDTVSIDSKNVLNDAKKIKDDDIRIYNGEKDYVAIVYTSKASKVFDFDSTTLLILDSEGNKLEDIFVGGVGLVHTESVEGFEKRVKYTDDAVYYMSKADNCATSDGNNVIMDEYKITFENGILNKTKTGKQYLAPQAGQGICY